MHDVVDKFVPSKVRNWIQMCKVNKTNNHDHRL